jgi:hypothetical protein
MSAIKRTFALLGIAALAWMNACHSPDGGTAILSFTGGPQTIQSTETIQKTVRMVDMRSGEVFFSLDIPAGKQLTYDFDRDDGDDPVYTPDLMRYEVKDIGDKTGKLSNAMTVPNANSRRIDVFVRQGILYQNQSAEQAAMRTDQPSDRPDWWSPRGGAMPDDNSRAMYDN